VEMNNKTFCILPWVHVYAAPTGSALPCCVADPTYTIGNSNNMSIDQLVNSVPMKQLRLDMLAGKENPLCNRCYHHERLTGASPRNNSERLMQEYFEKTGIDYRSKVDELIHNTQPDGTLTDFKMYYFDIRFNNICNFKCRTCNADFSSQWEQEDIKENVIQDRRISKNNSSGLIQDVLKHVPYFGHVYFAGGEPLITEEHYIVLEEMIRQNKTDVTLRYNTNISNLKFKNKDLLSLWKNFDKVEISASIDHYGKRAEYIRHGTKWKEIENNFKLLKATPNLQLQINTVVSVFNILTLHEFYEYLHDNGLYGTTDQTYSVFPLITPQEFSGLILPREYKEKAIDNIVKLIGKMHSIGYSELAKSNLIALLKWIYSENTWDQYKETFKLEVNRIDRIRGEDFEKTFPELAGLLDYE
jgi:MoaA/NifB/PqqE/SkfB family radical SAM enzyme